MTDVEIFCCLVGSNRPFSVDISTSRTVSHLKEMIKQKKQNDLKEIDADKLDLFKVDVPSGRDLEKRVKDAVVDLEPLDPTADVMEIFPDMPPKKTIHIAVKLSDDADIYKDNDGNHPRKRPRFDFAPTPITEEDSSPLNKWMLAMHRFLWDDEGKDRLETLITTTNVAVPPLYPDADADTDQQPTSYEAKKYDLTKISGYEEYKTDSKEAKNQLAETFYYRDEYKEVDELDKESACGTRAFDIFLLGHPGIGKTTYLTYRLVNRLARKQPTYLLMSPDNRYLFVNEGVFHVPADKKAVYELIKHHRTRESLALYDLNEEHGQVQPSLFYEWRGIVASSPRPSRYRDWDKNAKPRRFVMKTWSWEEVYTARSVSLVKRDDDAWREAFLKWGGSARHLFGSSEEELEMWLQNAVTQAADVKSLLIDTDGMKDNISHHLVLANPRDKNGKLSRTIMVSKLISPYIIKVLVQRCQMEMTRSLIDKLKRSLIHGVVGSDDGFMFEEFGHTIVQRSLKRGFEAHKLPKSTQRPPQLFNFADFSDLDTQAYFDKDVRPEQLPTGCYYRPDTRTFAGIDAFALASRTIILFQFTLAKDHPINAKWLYNWHLKSKEMQGWEWKFIFVVPKAHSQLTTIQSMSHKTMAGKISQYVFEIDIDTYLA